MFTCLEAVKIAKACKTADGIAKFKKMGWEAQKKMANISDGHSGNTFGCACYLATLYIQSPEYVEKMHGALTPLVGCEAYGCSHAA